RFQVDLLPVAFDDSGANLGGRFPLLALLVRIVELFKASGALRAVGILEAAVQAVVPHAVAITVARLLMNHVGNLGRQFVGVGLIRVLGVGSPEICLGKDRGQLRAFRRRGGIKGRNATALLL